jgi:hypothetical protein
VTGDSASVARAADVRAFVRAHRRPVRPSAYSVYMTILVCAVVGALGHGIVTSLLAGGISVHALLVFGPALLALVLLAAARFGTWQGPVSFSAPDVALLLMAPIATADLVEPKLDRALLAGAVAGAALGAIAILLITGGPAGLGAARSICAVVGIAGLGVSAVSASWLVQSSRRAAGWVRRLSPAVVTIAAALAVVEAVSRTSILAFSGPWGWGVAPLAGVSGWPVATALMVSAAVVLAWWARGRAGAATIELFNVRAGTRSALTVSAFMLDYRGAALAHRAAQPARAWRGVRFPLPERPRLALAWRDATALGRELARVCWASLLGAGAAALALARPGNVVLALIAAGGLYFAAALLCEPLRVDIDQPDRSPVLLSWEFARMLVAHCLVPLVTLAVIVAVTIVGTVAAGVASAGALLLIATVLLPITATAVLAAAHGARRGGRISQELLSRILTTDPSNPASAVIAVLLTAPWLICTLLTVGVPIALLGHAAAHHRPLLGAGVAAFGIAAATAAALLGSARRAVRGD